MFNKEDILEVNNSLYTIVDIIKKDNNEYYYLSALKDDTNPKFVICKSAVINGTLNMCKLDDNEFEEVKNLFFNNIN